MGIDTIQQKIYRGDTFRGFFKLSTLSPGDPDRRNPYAIPSGATIELWFPGDTSTVILSTGASEITILDANNGSCSFKGGPAKSVLMAAGSGQAVDAIVTELSGDKTTFEKCKILTILDRANG